MTDKVTFCYAMFCNWAEINREKSIKPRNLSAILLINQLRALNLFFYQSLKNAHNKRYME
jgi:hypothetical protein